MKYEFERNEEIHDRVEEAIVRIEEYESFAR